MWKDRIVANKKRNKNIGNLWGYKFNTGIKNFKILKQTKILWLMKIHRYIYSSEFAFDLSKQSIKLKIIVFHEIVYVSLKAALRSLELFITLFVKF